MRTCESRPMTAVPAPSAMPAVSSGSERGQQRAEHEEQHDQRRERTEADAAHIRAVRQLRDLALDLDLQTASGAGLRGVDELLRLAGRELVRLLGQRHGRERDLARARDLRGAARPVGRGDRRNVAERADAGEHPLGLRAHRGVGDLAGADRDHDLLAVARRLRGDPRQQVLRLEALRPVEAEAVLVRRADAAADRRQTDERDEPAGQGESTIPDAPAGDASHKRSPIRVDGAATARQAGAGWLECTPSQTTYRLSSKY